MGKYIQQFEVGAFQPSPMIVKRTDHEVEKRLARAMCRVRNINPDHVNQDGSFQYEFYIEAARNYLLADAAMDLINRGEA